MPSLQQLSEMAVRVMKAVEDQISSALPSCFFRWKFLTASDTTKSCNQAMFMPLCIKLEAGESQLWAAYVQSPQWNYEVGCCHEFSYLPDNKSCHPWPRSSLTASWRAVLLSSTTMSLCHIFYEADVAMPHTTELWRSACCSTATGRKLWNPSLGLTSSKLSINGRLVNWGQNWKGWAGCITC